MPVSYENLEVLHADATADAGAWFHEGVGEIIALPDGGLRGCCTGSVQGAEGCMAFFRPELPDHIAIEYDITVLKQGGLVINYLAMRGMQGEDLIEDREQLPPRTGVMADYWSAHWGLQSYHLSFSRFDDRGVHTETSNWRRNPGAYLVGHGIDPVQEIGRRYHVRITKDYGHCQLFVDGQFAHGFIDHRTDPPIPDTGKFGIRLIGPDVAVEVSDLQIYRIAAKDVWHPWVYSGDVPSPRVSGTR